MITPTVNYNLYQPLLADNRCIQYVNTFNYIGVLIDDQLTFTPYYHQVKRQMDNKFVLSKIRRHIDCKIAILIYKQAIVPLV